MRSTPREKLAFGSVILLLGVALAGRSSWQNSLNRFVILHSDAADKAVIIEAANGGENIEKFSTRLLASAKMPHRVAAVEILLTRQPAFYSPELQKLLKAAAADPDPVVCEGAIKLLGKTDRRAAVELAIRLLSDPDPARRIIGLEQMRSLRATNAFDFVAALLDDADSRVRVQSAHALGALSGRNFGVKIATAPPSFRSSGVPALGEEVDSTLRRVREDWNTYRSTALSAPLTDVKMSSPSARGPSISIRRLGLAIKGDEAEAGLIWLCFLGAGDENSYTLEQLRHIRDSHSELRVIIATVADACHSHGEENSACRPPYQTAKPLSAEFEQVHDSIYAAAALAISELPTHVLIGPSGRVERKFTGFRETHVLEAMLNPFKNADQANDNRHHSAK